MANGDSPRKQGTLSTLLLPAALASLAIAVAILAWIVLARLDALDEAHKEIKEAVEQRVTKKRFEERIDELEQLIGGCCTKEDKTIPRVEVMFDNARLLQDDPEQPPLDALQKGSPGIALLPTEGKRLDKLADALVACAELGEVRLRVQGFSSTRPFRRNSMVLPESDQLNWKAANLRAQVVIDRLVAWDPKGMSHVDIRHEPWHDYSAIQRPFEDKERFPGIAQEQLNRIVYIDLQDAGGCERTT